MNTYIKKLTPVLFIFLFLLSFQLNAQADYLLMIDEGTHKVSEVQQAAEAYFKDRPKGKGSGYKQYKRWEYLALRMKDEQGYLKSSDFYSNELNQFNVQLNSNANNRAALNDNWEEMGPLDWNATSGWNPGVGRITAFSIDENDENHIIVGAQTGGVWKTIDGGQNWQPLLDTFANMFVYSTAMEPGNSNTYFFGSSQGRIYKSTDAGATWNPIGNAGNSFVNKIVIHPTNTNIMFASSQNSGIFRSTDGGVNWTNVTTDNRGYDIEFKPSDINTVYATGDSFHKSTDGGATFSTLSGFDDTGAKMMGVSPDNPNVVYVIEENNAEFNGFYVSTNSGNTFTKLNHSGINYFGYDLNGQDNLGQAPRDMDIVVNPQDVSEVHIAGILTWRSLDGGVTFVPTSFWVPGTAAANNIGYNHADVDIMQFYGTTLYTGTDGGIFKATNTINLNSNYYTDITQGLGIRQFYKIGVSQTDPVIVSGGSQDNGTSFYTESDGWRDWLGADGMESFIDKNNSDIMYGTTQFGKLYRSSTGGLSYDGLDEPGPGQGNWVTPFEQDPIDSNTLYVGYDQVFKSTNSGVSWTAISQNFTNNLDNLKISPVDNQIMYASRAGLLFKTTTGSGTWQQITGFSGSINSIALHPTDADKVAIATTTSQKVFISNDGGQNWQAVNNGLPNFQALALVWQDNGQDGLYLGMNYGIYYIDNTFSSWQVFNNNLPNVIINELEINTAENKLYAATYGRGLWVSPVYDGNLGVENTNLFNTLSVFPVPSDNLIYLKWDQNYPSDIRLFDNGGKLLHFHQEVSLVEKYTLDISKLKSGVYYLRINNAKGVSTKKIIKK